jgi:hypothetical protein
MNKVCCPICPLSKSFCEYAFSTRWLHSQAIGLSAGGESQAFGQSDSHAVYGRYIKHPILYSTRALFFSPWRRNGRKKNKRAGRRLQKLESPIRKMKEHACCHAFSHAFSKELTETRHLQMASSLFMLVTIGVYIWHSTLRDTHGQVREGSPRRRFILTCMAFEIFP